MGERDLVCALTASEREYVRLWYPPTATPLLKQLAQDSRISEGTVALDTDGLLSLRFPSMRAQRALEAVTKLNQCLFAAADLVYPWRRLNGIIEEDLEPVMDREGDACFALDEHCIYRQILLERVNWLAAEIIPDFSGVVNGRLVVRAECA